MRPGGSSHILLLGGNIVLDSLKTFFIHGLRITGTAKLQYGIVTKNCLSVTVWEVHMQTSSFKYTQSISADSQEATIIVQQSTFTGSSEAVFQLSDKRIKGNLNITIMNSEFSNNLQGGIAIDTSLTLYIDIHQVDIVDNKVDSSGNGLAAALSIKSITQSDTTVDLHQIGFFL